MSGKELFIRYLIMVPGVFVLSFGIAFITKAGLGTSPISSIPYTLSLIMPGVSLGQFTIIVNVPARAACLKGSKYFSRRIWMGR